MPGLQYCGKSASLGLPELPRPDSWQEAEQHSPFSSRNGLKLKETRRDLKRHIKDMHNFLRVAGAKRIAFCRHFLVLESVVPYLHRVLSCLCSRLVTACHVTNCGLS